MADVDWVVTTSHFGLTIDTVTPALGLFQKVSGLGVEIKAVPVTEGGQNNYVHQLPGPMQWQNIELERGLVRTDVLLDWLHKFSGDGLERGKAPRRDGVITLYSNTAVNKKVDGVPIPLRQWKFKAGFPVKWTGPSFDADSDNVATEKLVIAHAGLVAKTL